LLFLWGEEGSQTWKKICDLSVVLCRAEIKPHFSKAAAAFLPACKKAAADFEKCGFISLSSTQNNREVTKNEAALSQKAAIHARLHCTRTTKLSKNTALFASSLPAGTKAHFSVLRACSEGK